MAAFSCGLARCRRAAFTSISSYSPGLAKSFCAVAVSNRVRLPPAATLPSSVVKMPVTVGLQDRAVDGQPDGVADLVAGALGGLGVDGDLVRALGARRLLHRVAGVRPSPQ